MNMLERASNGQPINFVTFYNSIIAPNSFGQLEGGSMGKCDRIVAQHLDNQLTPTSLAGWGIGMGCLKLHFER